MRQHFEIVYTVYVRKQCLVIPLVVLRRHNEPDEIRTGYVQNMFQASQCTEIWGFISDLETEKGN
jgi:hypothetical protein